MEWKKLFGVGGYAPYSIGGGAALLLKFREAVGAMPPNPFEWGYAPLILPL